MINAETLKGEHHIQGYNLHLAWTQDPQKTEYEPVYDGLVLNEDNIAAVAQRIRMSLGNQEPVIVALFVPKDHKNVTKATGRVLRSKITYNPSSYIGPDH